MAGERHRKATFDLAVELRDRDRDAFASVLGSAIALRLFLFTVSVLVALVSFLNLLVGDWGMENLLSSSGVTGQVADEVEEATRQNTGRDVGLLLTGFVLSLSAGRGLTRVLAACSAGAWRLDARAAKPTVRVAARVTALSALLIVAGSGLTRLRDAYGIAVAAGSIALNIVVVGIGWFFVCLSLPRRTRDPGAMIPGAVIFGVVITAVQWFMHFYLPRRIANASEVMGSIGFSVATLGYLFVIGRVMAGSIVVNAVVWERFGTISELVFSLPLIRRLPDRFPRIATFFDLERASTTPDLSGPSGEDRAC